MHNDLGLAYSKAGNAAAARDSLNKAISLDGKEVRYRNNLATVLVENGQADEAVKQLQQVLPPAVAHYNVAYLHYTKQNIPAAQQQLQAALQIDPNLEKARKLYELVGGGQAIAGAQNAYQTASNILSTNARRRLRWRCAGFNCQHTRRPNAICANAFNANALCANANQSSTGLGKHARYAVIYRTATAALRRHLCRRRAYIALSSLHIQVSYIERMFLDEVATRLNFVAL